MLKIAVKSKNKAVVSVKLLVKHEQQTDFLNTVCNHTNATLPLKTHSLQAFCSGLRDIDEPLTFSSAYTSDRSISQQSC